MVQHGGTGLPPGPGADQAFDGRAVAGPVVPPLPRSEPTRLRIPAIGVDAPFTPLDLDAGGTLRPPPDDDRNLAGWYRGGATPGQRGASIVAGHVDTLDGPAVFYRLGTLHKGDQLEIARADRSTAYFAVDGVEVYPKKDFPDRKVYDPTGDAQLRLITCGGGFTRENGYDGNVVVYAHLIRTLRG
ncbi:class F sortase [Kitasatospora sp. NPDC048540]|uniref:class F sortase n=1 Tax=unclassified Kitasatospora TaxID=2633591 RepID=UPI0009EC1216|nr:class F sortase [Kitasatospora sp. MBT63]